ncbi:MAG: hypothetical protein WBP22_00315 [Candidatus Saccharimonas sp.]
MWQQVTTGSRDTSDMTNEKNPTNEGEITVDIARLGSIQVYQITEDELNMIEMGTPNSNYLNFSVALLSVFISFLITLLTTKIEDDRVFNFFLLTAIVTVIIGVILLIIWLKSRYSSRNIFKKIRARKSNDAVREAVKQTAEGPQADSDSMAQQDQSSS